MTAAHEFFHAVQFHYDIGEDIWFMEGTATWIEDEAYDDVNDSLRYLPSGPMGQPLVPLDRNTGFRIYGTWIFWRSWPSTSAGRSPRTGSFARRGTVPTGRRAAPTATRPRRPRRRSPRGP